MTKPLEKQKEEQTEEALLTRSDLWRTLFRGGYMLGKLTRSLSEAHVRLHFLSCVHHTYCDRHFPSVSQTASPATSELNIWLHNMANGGAKQLLDRSVAARV